MPGIAHLVRRKGDNGDVMQKLGPLGRHEGVAAALPLIIDRLVRGFDPDQVILFGSRARGDSRPDSDIDLLVVLPRLEEGGRKTRVAMLRVLRDLDVAVDIMVTTPADIDRRGGIPSIPLHAALREGVNLYARP